MISNRERIIALSTAAIGAALLLLLGSSGILVFQKAAAVSECIAYVKKDPRLNWAYVGDAANLVNRLCAFWEKGGYIAGVPINNLENGADGCYKAVVGKLHDIPARTICNYLNPPK